MYTQQLHYYSKRSFINLMDLFSIDLNQCHCLDYTVTDVLDFIVGLYYCLHIYLLLQNRCLLLIVHLNLLCTSLSYLNLCWCSYISNKSLLYFTIYVCESLWTTVFQGLSLQGCSDGICVTFEPWFHPRFLPLPWGVVYCSVFMTAIDKSSK